jgi:hypothetical protein
MFNLQFAICNLQIFVLPPGRNLRVATAVERPPESTLASNG